MNRGRKTNDVHSEKTAAAIGKQNVRSQGDGMESVKAEEAGSSSKYDTFRVSKPELERTVVCKEPKFVPYEPYRAAVNPIVPADGCSKKKSKKQTGGVKMPEGVCCDSCERVKQLFAVESSRWEAQREEMLASIRRLRQENKCLSGQLDVQTEVNREVKKLLVASIGEDLSTRVHFLTEDKLKLAQNILQYSEGKAKDAEMVEKLEVECDVWRSKFWALSMMVDELAHWKANLGSQLNEALSALRCLMAERKEISTNLIRACGGSSNQSRNDEAKLKPKKHYTTVDLAQKLASRDSLEEEELAIVPSFAETKAVNVLSNAESLFFHSCSEASSKTHSAAPVIPRFHVGSKFEHLTFHCCPHCKGEISVI